MGSSRRTRRMTAGVIGLLAIASGTIATATPGWAATYRVINDGVQFDDAFVNCSLGCSIVGSQGFNPGDKNTFDVPSNPNGWGEYPTATVSAKLALSYNQEFMFNISNSSSSATMSCTGSVYTGSGFSASAGHAYFVAHPDYSANTCTAIPITQTKGLNAGKFAYPRITTNRAVVKNGKAKIRIISYSTKATNVKERVVLRDSKGRVIGKTTARVGTNRRAYLKVALPNRILKKVRTGKHVTINAHLKHADKTRGSGHKTSELVLTKSK